VQKLKILTAIATMMVASPVLAQEITVWDVNVDDAAHATYYDHAKAAFEAAHPGATLAAQHRLAERLVLGPLRKRLVGGRLRFFISGGAALAREIEEFFEPWRPHRYRVVQLLAMMPRTRAPRRGPRMARQDYRRI